MVEGRDVRASGGPGQGTSMSEGPQGPEGGTSPSRLGVGQTDAFGSVHLVSTCHQGSPQGDLTSDLWPSRRSQVPPNRLPHSRSLRHHCCPWPPQKATQCQPNRLGNRSRIVAIAFLFFSRAAARSCVSSLRDVDRDATAVCHALYRPIRQLQRE